MMSAEDALASLRKGNVRFVEGRYDPHSGTGVDRREKLKRGQEPIAIVLGCSDARVPAEIVFDQGLGDLFVIRVAGNIVAPSQIGSIEFAADQFGTRLVVVLGHSRCGAVEATLAELQRDEQSRSVNLRSIVDRIRPSVEPVLHADPDASPDQLLSRAVRANIDASVAQLRSGSKILRHLIDDDGLIVIGAYYSLDTGRVEFFEQ